MYILSSQNQLSAQFSVRGCTRSISLIFRCVSLPRDAVHLQAEYSIQYNTTVHAQCTRSHPLLVVILDLRRRHPCTCHHRHADRAHNDYSVYSCELTTSTRVVHQSNWCMDVHLPRVCFRLVIGVCCHPYVFARRNSRTPTKQFQKTSHSTRWRHHTRKGNAMANTICCRVPHLCDLLCAALGYKHHVQMCTFWCTLCPIVKYCSNYHFSSINLCLLDKTIHLGAFLLDWIGDLIWFHIWNQINGVEFLAARY